jgi:hypothetical protein
MGLQPHGGQNSLRCGRMRPELRSQPRIRQAANPRRERTERPLLPLMRPQSASYRNERKMHHAAGEPLSAGHRYTCPQAGPRWLHRRNWGNGDMVRLIVDDSNCCTALGSASKCPPRLSRFLAHRYLLPPRASASRRPSRNSFQKSAFDETRDGGSTAGCSSDTASATDPRVRPSRRKTACARSIANITNCFHILVRPALPGNSGTHPTVRPSRRRPLQPRSNDRTASRRPLKYWGA